MAVQRNMKPKLTVRRGDEVEIIAGKDKGKRGTITRVYPENNRVIVDGANLVKRHLRRQPGALQAGIIDKPAPLSRSNVMLVCPRCDRPARVGHAVMGDGSHARTCKNCNEVIDREA